MNWIQRYHLRHYVRNSAWLLPVIGMAAALVSVYVFHWIEKRAGWQSSLDPAAALTLFGILAGSMLTFIVFLSSSLLFVVQLASAQLNPRIIGVVFRDRVLPRRRPHEDGGEDMHAKPQRILQPVTTL